MPTEEETRQQVMDDIAAGRMDPSDLPDQAAIDAEVQLRMQRQQEEQARQAREQEAIAAVTPPEPGLPRPGEAQQPREAGLDDLRFPQLTAEEFARQTGLSVEEARERLAGGPPTPTGVDRAERAREAGLIEEAELLEARVAGVDPDSVRAAQEFRAEQELGEAISSGDVPDVGIGEARSEQAERLRSMAALGQFTQVDDATGEQFVDVVGALRAGQEQRLRAMGITPAQLEAARPQADALDALEPWRAPDGTYDLAAAATRVPASTLRAAGFTPAQIEQAQATRAETVLASGPLLSLTDNNALRQLREVAFQERRVAELQGELEAAREVEAPGGPVQQTLQAQLEAAIPQRDQAHQRYAEAVANIDVPAAEARLQTEAGTIRQRLEAQVAQSRGVSPLTVFPAATTADVRPLSAAEVAAAERDIERLREFEARGGAFPQLETQAGQQALAGFVRQTAAMTPEELFTFGAQSAALTGATGVALRGAGAVGGAVASDARFLAGGIRTLTAEARAAQSLAQQRVALAAQAQRPLTQAEINATTRDVQTFLRIANRGGAPRGAAPVAEDLTPTQLRSLERMRAAYQAGDNVRAQRIYETELLPVVGALPGAVGTTGVSPTPTAPTPVPVREPEVAPDVDDDFAPPSPREPLVFPDAPFTPFDPDEETGPLPPPLVPATEPAPDSAPFTPFDPDETPTLPEPLIAPLPEAEPLTEPEPFPGTSPSPEVVPVTEPLVDPSPATEPMPSTDPAPGPTTQPLTEAVIAEQTAPRERTGASPVVRTQAAAAAADAAGTGFTRPTGLPAPAPSPQPMPGRGAVPPPARPPARTPTRQPPPSRVARRPAGAKKQKPPATFPGLVTHKQGKVWVNFDKTTGRVVSYSAEAPAGVPKSKRGIRGKGSAARTYTVLSRTRKPPRGRSNRMGITNIHRNGGVRHTRARVKRKGKR